MTERTCIKAEHSESVVIRDSGLRDHPHHVIMKLYASGDDVVCLGPDARRAIAKRLLQDLEPGPLDNLPGDAEVHKHPVVSLDMLAQQLAVMREMEGGDIPMAVAVPGYGGFTTLNIGLCAPPVRMTSPWEAEEEITALLITAFPHTPGELEPALERLLSTPVGQRLPASDFGRTVPVTIEGTGTLLDGAYKGTFSGDHAVLENADPKELQNDGDPIKDAAEHPAGDATDMAGSVRRIESGE